MKGARNRGENMQRKIGERRTYSIEMSLNGKEAFRRYKKKEDLNGRGRRCRDVQFRHGSPRLADRDRHLQGNLGKTRGKEMMSVNLRRDNATWL